MICQVSKRLGTLSLAVKDLGQVVDDSLVTLANVVVPAGLVLVTLDLLAWVNLVHQRVVHLLLPTVTLGTESL